MDTVAIQDDFVSDENRDYHVIPGQVSDGHSSQCI